MEFLNSFFSHFANSYNSMTNSVKFGFLIVFIILCLGSLAAYILPKIDNKKWKDLSPRMKSWWVMVLLLFGTLFSGKTAFVILMAIVSFLALKEFISLAPTRKEDRPVIFLAFLAIPIAFFAVGLDIYGFFLTLVPVYLFLGLAVSMAWIGRTDGFLATVGIVYWGVVVCVTNLAYIPLLLQVPAYENPSGGPIGLVFFIIFVTEINDVAQYMWGKTLGRTKITPNVSPNKTREGLLGGLLTTYLVVWIFGPIFTPLTGLPLILLGVILPLAGFGGDITMSAIKRDLGVKDTSMAIPGHGGILDRVDSLTFTAPIFFHILAYFGLDKF